MTSTRPSSLTVASKRRWTSPAGTSSGGSGWRSGPGRTTCRRPARRRSAVPTTRASSSTCGSTSTTAWVVRRDVEREVAADGDVHPEPRSHTLIPRMSPSRDDRVNTRGPPSTVQRYGDRKRSSDRRRRHGAERGPSGPRAAAEHGRGRSPRDAAAIDKTGTLTTGIGGPRLRPRARRRPRRGRGLCRRDPTRRRRPIARSAACRLPTGGSTPARFPRTRAARRCGTDIGDGVVELVLLDQPRRGRGCWRGVVRFCAPVGIIIGVVAMSVFAVLRSAAVGAARTEAQSGATLVLTVGLVASWTSRRPIRRWRSRSGSSSVRSGSCWRLGTRPASPAPPWRSRDGSADELVPADRALAGASRPPRVPLRGCLGGSSRPPARRVHGPRVDRRPGCGAVRAGHLRVVVRHAAGPRGGRAAVPAGRGERRVRHRRQRARRPPRAARRPARRSPRPAAGRTARRRSRRQTGGGRVRGARAVAARRRRPDHRDGHAPRRGPETRPSTCWPTGPASRRVSSGGGSTARSGTARRSCLGWPGCSASPRVPCGRRRWGIAELAAAAGYVDQSHLAKDVRAIADRTPRQLLGVLAGSSLAVDVGADDRSVQDATGPAAARWAA